MAIMIGQAHSKFVHQRRVEILHQWMKYLVPASTISILDIGCGDGLILSKIAQSRPGVIAQGIDVVPRKQTHIPITLFDGVRIPYDDNSFDVVTMIDMLHHTEDPGAMLREANRVAKQYIIIKDHLSDGWLADERLRLMDYVGNARFGVALPCVYWKQRQWDKAFNDLGLTIQHWQTELGLYPWFANWLFGGSLHFVARLSLPGKE